MHKKYTVDDVVQSQDGNCFLKINMPDGKVCTFSGHFPERIACTANTYISAVVKVEAAKVPYSQGVEFLIDVALNQSGSGAWAAAQVLLSCYNGCNYQLDITDLCNLDSESFEHAQAVILGRVHTSSEPHMMIENGTKLFYEIQKKWSALNVRERYADYY